MHLSKNAQIAYLKADQAFIKVLNEYANFANIFSPKLAAKLAEHGISDHIIKQVDDWQPLYGSIYSLGHMKLELLKAYIEINLANGFIKPFKFPAGALIFLNKKSDDSRKLYVDYRNLNNLTIKNRCFLPLVGESLNRLG